MTSPTVFTLKVENDNSIPNGERITCVAEDGRVLWTSVADASVTSLADRLSENTDYEDLRTVFVEVSNPPTSDNSGYDLASLADEVVATRERLQAAEDALFYLLTTSLEGF